MSLVVFIEKEKKLLGLVPVVAEEGVDGFEVLLVQSCGAQIELQKMFHGL